MSDADWRAKALETIQSQRRLLADVRTALFAAGWHDDELMRRLKAASAEVAPADSAPNGGGL